MIFFAVGDGQKRNLLAAQFFFNNRFFTGGFKDFI